MKSIVKHSASMRQGVVALEFRPRAAAIPPNQVDHELLPSNAWFWWLEQLPKNEGEPLTSAASAEVGDATMVPS